MIRYEDSEGYAVADPEHLNILERGVSCWNWWKRDMPRPNEVRKADLRGADLQEVRLPGVDFRWDDLRGANLKGADLGDARLWSADLRRANLQRASLKKTNFIGANLEGAILGESDSRVACLDRANLTEVDFRNADVRDARIREADLRRSNFEGADLRGAFLTASRIEGSNFKGVRLVKKWDQPWITADYSPLWCFLQAKGHETVSFSDGFLEDCVTKAFSVVCHVKSRYHSDYMNKIERRIKCLRTLVRTENPPSTLIKNVSSTIGELLELLKRHPGELYSVSPRRFEELVAEILACYGWQVQLTPETRDGGYDIFAITKDISGVQSSWIIECKRNRRDRKVGIDVVRSLYAVKGELKVANAMLATTSDFTRGAYEFKTSRYDFDLRNYEAILEWINQYRPNPSGNLYIEDNKLMAS